MSDELPRSLKWRVYGIVRPLVRPVMLRIRIYFTGRLHDEIVQLRGEIRELRDLVTRQSVQADRSADDRVSEVIAQALATLALDREHDRR